MTKKEARLVDELMCIATEMDEVYRFHPENPNQIDATSYYNELSERKNLIEKELQTVSEQEEVN